MKFCFIIISVCFSCSFPAQKPGQTDTINIYRNKSGVGFKKYLHTWFHSYGLLNSYSYDLSKLNAQDSLVMLDTSVYYFKIYDSENRLRMSGKNGYHPYMTGDINYYYTNGRLKRTEHYNNKLQIDTCLYSALLNDAPGKEGKWFYYRKNGTLKKTKEYFGKCISCEKNRFFFAKRIIRFNRKHQIISTRTKKIQ